MIDSSGSVEVELSDYCGSSQGDHEEEEPDPQSDGRRNLPAERGAEPLNIDPVNRRRPEPEMKKSSMVWPLPFCFLVSWHQFCVHSLVCCLELLNTKRERLGEWTQSSHWLPWLHLVMKKTPNWALCTRMVVTTVVSARSQYDDGQNKFITMQFCCCGVWG